MDKQALTTAMTASISEVLESMFFLPIDLVADTAVDTAAADGDPTVAARVDFSGPSTGCFLLRVPGELARTVASDFLGVDIAAVARDDIEGTIREMLNMLAGNTLSRYDPDTVFDLGVPATMPIGAVDADARDGGEAVCLDIRTLSSQMALTAVFGI